MSGTGKATQDVIALSAITCSVTILFVVVYLQMLRAGVGRQHTVTFVLCVCGMHVPLRQTMRYCVAATIFFVVQGSCSTMGRRYCCPLRLNGAQVLTHALLLSVGN